MTGKRTSTTLVRPSRTRTFVAEASSAEDRPAGGRPAGEGKAPSQVDNPTTGKARSSLPLVVDSFLGREADLHGVQALFEQGRLVTITGAPGMGKTRLAVEVARADTRPDGVALVALAPLAGPDLVLSAAASALQIEGAAGPETLDHLVAGIGDRRVLLVLDNCEHVLGACARLAASLVESCPNLRVPTYATRR